MSTRVGSSSNNLYNLADFIFSAHMLDHQGIEVYEKPGLNKFTSTAGDLHDALKGTGLEFKEDVYWEGILAVSRFDRSGLKAVELHPMDLGGERPRPQQGTPRIPDPAKAKTIIDRVARLSAPFGTKVRFENGIGIVDLSASTAQKK